MGIKGYTNYNSVVALKQLDYPMLKKLDDESLEVLILHNKGIEDPHML